MFNALSSLGAVDDAVVVDLFAGSGALGIEALSRGATSCTFVESNSAAASCIRANIRHLGLEDRSTVVMARVESVPASLGRVDLVLADPPYDYDRWEELLQSIEPVLSDGAVVVIESGSDIQSLIGELEGWSVVRVKRYGRTWVTFLHRM